MIALQTITGKQQFCEEPTARNSNRLPQKGKGAVPGGPSELIAGRSLCSNKPPTRSGDKVEICWGCVCQSVSAGSVQLKIGISMNLTHLTLGTVDPGSLHSICLVRSACLQLKMHHTRSATLCLGFGHVSHYDIGNPHIGHELIPYSLRHDHPPI